MEKNPLSLRSWFIFIGFELLLVAVLAAMSAFSAWTLAATGVALFAVLWVWDHRRHRITRPAGIAVSWAVDWLKAVDPEISLERSIVASETQASSDDEGVTTGEAHERLELFLIDYVRPACYAQISLQEETLKLLCGNEKFLFLAKRGLTNDYTHRDFCDNFKKIASLGDSPMPVMANGEMIECIVVLENNSYRKFCDQAAELSKSANIEHRDHPVLGQFWEIWRIVHNALVEEYDKLKRESRFPQPLYRPLRESRWGGIVPPFSPSA